MPKVNKHAVSVNNYPYNPTTAEPPNVRAERENALRLSRATRGSRLNRHSQVRRQLNFTDIELNHDADLSPNGQQTENLYSPASQTLTHYSPTLFKSYEQEDLVQYFLNQAMAKLNLTKNTIQPELFSRIYPLAVEQAKLLRETASAREISTLLALQNKTGDSTSLDIERTIINFETMRIEPITEERESVEVVPTSYSRF